MKILRTVSQEEMVHELQERITAEGPDAPLPFERDLMRGLLARMVPVPPPTSPTP